MSRSSSVAGRITKAAAALREAEQPLRILGLLAWPLSVRERFLERSGRELPRVDYPDVDAAAVDEALARARPLIAGTGPAREWFERIADRLDLAGRMMKGIGSTTFFDASRELYGSPGEALPDSSDSPLQLAKRLRRIIDGLNHLDLGAPDDPSATDRQVARRMRAAVTRFFGADAPPVEIVAELSANATAGPDRIRIRAGARFTDRDVEQLVHHEAGIHVATALNGRAQAALPILASSHPGTTRTQEGLAVFAEFITGGMDVDRLGRLADRVLAIQMAVDGADFIEVYDHFLEQGRAAAARQSVQPRDEDLQRTAFEQARRVFRGGVLAGGAPFTKDVVYLDGLLRVHDFLRSVVAAGRADVLQLLFCGKLSLGDIPVLCELAEMGLLRAPKFLPRWAADRRFLVSYLAYSGFLGRVRMGRVHERYAEVLATAPVARFSRP
ncbi:flavohemoglobin expression-modulating QEGLA motif protein [Wenzhouxiangella sediminis]|uniref:flavohemoglobin expression-modulating QEGLA motif protein n=1 Tax=Wenzhouxiangella sediminis TaxID=1792836 RepID=UPI001C6EA649|nr:flavohemoglobin expression-modulating QEGLA motif protein [Wenzhouxiangella sediminis]